MYLCVAKRRVPTNRGITPLMGSKQQLFFSEIKDFLGAIGKFLSAVGVHGGLCRKFSDFNTKYI